MTVEIGSTPFNRLPRRGEPAVSRGGVHQRFLDRRAIALLSAGRPDADEHRIEPAIAASPTLAAALEPRSLDDRRVGIILEDHILAELRAAIIA